MIAVFDGFIRSNVGLGFCFFSLASLITSIAIMVYGVAKKNILGLKLYVCIEMLLYVTIAILLSSYSGMKYAAFLIEYGGKNAQTVDLIQIYLSRSVVVLWASLIKAFLFSFLLGVEKVRNYKASGE